MVAAEFRGVGLALAASYEEAPPRDAASTRIPAGLHVAGSG